MSSKAEKMGATLRALRLRHGLDQESAAAMAGVAQGTWSKFESGRNSVTKVCLGKFLNAVGIEAAAFDRMWRRPNPPAMLRWSTQAIGPDEKVVDEVTLIKWLGLDPLAAKIVTKTPAAPVSGIGREMAANVRHAWEVGRLTPLADLSVIFGQNGIILLPAAIKRGGAGMIILGDKEVFGVVAVVASDSAADQRWNAARLLCSLLCRARTGGRGAIPSDEDLDHFAQEFLLPGDALNANLNWVAHRGNPAKHLLATVIYVVCSYGIPYPRVRERIVHLNHKSAPLLPPTIPAADPARVSTIPSWLAYLRGAFP